MAHLKCAALTGVRVRLPLEAQMDIEDLEEDEDTSEFPIIQRGPGWRTWHFTRRLLVTWASPKVWSLNYHSQPWAYAFDNDNTSVYVRFLGLEVTWLKS